MTTTRKRPTALDKAKLRIEELEERNASLQRSWEFERASVRRLEARCGFLYEMALTFVDEGARSRLSGDGVNNGLNDGSVPRSENVEGGWKLVGHVAPSTEKRTGLKR